MPVNRDTASPALAIAPMLSNMTLKKQLRLHLEHRRMTAAQLARESAVPKQSISGWLSGNNPRDVRQLKKVADVLKTTIDNLMFGDGLSESEERSASLDALLGDDWIGGTFEIRLRRVKK